MEGTGKTGKTASGDLKGSRVVTVRNTDAFSGVAGGVIEFDENADTVAICGVVYSMHIFRTMSIAEPGMWFRIEDRRDCLTVSTVSEECERAFDLIAKKGRFRK
jgi:hypothetical protein